MKMQLDTKEQCKARLDDLFETPPEHIGKVDIAILNLICAPNLPGSENLNVPKYLARLDHLTDFVREKTRLNADWLAKHVNYATEAQERMGLIVKNLKLDFGASYHPIVAEDLAYETHVPSSDSREDFIHGLLDDDRNKRWGTCATFPVIITSIARRLGYPVSLAVNVRHIFARWEGKGECFNIEAANPAAMTVDNDEHYKTWPERMNERDAASGFYVRSLTPAEEFAMFMVKRVWYLYDFALYDECLLWAARALQFAPNHPRFWYLASMIAWTEIKHRWRRRYPKYELPDCAEEQPFLPVFEVLRPVERSHVLTIEAHRCEWEGRLDQAQEHFENSCRHNRWGHNEQRDLQRFLKKHGRKRRPGPLMPPEGFDKLRRYGIRAKPEEHADILKKLADQLEREAKILEARDALQDLYLFDPSNAEVYQRFHALEKSPMGQVQMMAQLRKQQAEQKKASATFSKFANPDANSAKKLRLVR